MVFKMEYKTKYLLQGNGCYIQDLNLHEIVITENDDEGELMEEVMEQNMTNFDSWLHVEKSEKNIKVLRELADKIEQDLCVENGN